MLCIRIEDDEPNEEQAMSSRNRAGEGAWNVSFDGSITIDNPSQGTHKTVCGRINIEASDQRTWVLHLRLGTEALPMVTLAGTDSMRSGIIREAIISAVEAVEITSESDEIPQ